MAKAEVSTIEMENVYDFIGVWTRDEDETIIEIYKSPDKGIYFALRASNDRELIGTVSLDWLKDKVRKKKKDGKKNKQKKEKKETATAF